MTRRGGEEGWGEKLKMTNIRSYRDLRVYQSAFSNAMRIFELTKTFPVEERYSLVDQVRRASRSVCTNLAEAWRKRPYPAHFISKLSDAEAEAAECRVWLQFAKECRYLNESVTDELDLEYDRILAQLVSMINHPEQWTIRPFDP